MLSKISLPNRLPVKIGAVVIASDVPTEATRKPCNSCPVKETGFNIPKTPGVIRLFFDAFAKSIKLDG